MLLSLLTAAAEVALQAASAAAELVGAGAAPAAGSSAGPLAAAPALSDVVGSTGGPAPSVLAVFILAVVQGLTEFLPVSSSGHLAIGRELLDMREGGLALDVALHVGTLFAIIIAFRADVYRLFEDLFAGRFGMWIWLIVATLPVGIVGMVFKDQVEHASGTVRAAGMGLFVTATALMVGERFRRRSSAATGSARGRDPALDPVTGRPATPPLIEALVMGLAQCVAIWPGVSRSGSTISAGLVRGMSAEQAARLSFLMSLPAISGAAIVELPGALDEGFGALSGWVVLGAAALAGLVGFAALKTLLLVLKKGSFPYFAAYCAMLGTAALVLN